MATATRASSREMALKIALVFGSILVALLVIEFGLRTTGHQPRRAEAADAALGSWSAPNSEMGWVNRPGVSLSTEPGHVAMSFEADGSRTDPAANKPKSFPRILVVGCSLTQGYGVADDQTYSHLINQSLPSAEAVNYGTAGYGAYQSILRIRNYFRDPHADTPLVIYGLFYGHQIRDIATLTWILMLSTRDGGYMVPPNVRAVSGKIVESAGGPIGLWPLEVHSAAVALVHRLFFRAFGDYTVDLAMGREVLHYTTLEMKRTVAQNNAKLLIVGLTKVPPEDLEWLKAQREDNGVDFVDCHNPGFGKDPALLVGGVGHPGERMHREWADCVLKALQERGYTVDTRALADIKGADAKAN